MKSRDIISVNSPVAIFFYNRPDLLGQLLKRLESAEFRVIYLISDGPKFDKNVDQHLVEECRNIAENKLNAKQIVTRYRPFNVGMPKNLTDGITWVFEKEEFCIFLEDDTVPELSFFKFCEELNIKYQGDKKVFSIAGFNRFYSPASLKKKHSYFFSSYPSLWGWASWSEKWKNTYDYDLVSWPEIKLQAKFRMAFPRTQERKYWERKLDLVYQNKYTWDTQLVLTHRLHDLVSIIPSTNLVSNIGFGRHDSTNTKELSGLAKVVPGQIIFPMKHPTKINNDEEYDKKLGRYFAPTLGKRIRMKMLRLCHRWWSKKR